MPKTPSLTSFRRIVVKVGSALLVDSAAGKLKHEWLASLAADIASLHKDKRDILVVSSGAIALGRAVLKLPAGALRLEEAQAAAAVGQISLARAWSEALGARGLAAGQVLLTLGDTEERRRYLNARETIDKLLEWKSVPVINENDTVATSEIRYGDNDRLAARVATMMSADLLVLLSDVDGLYDKPPAHGGAKRVPLVTRITPEIEAMAGASGSELSRGGMRTKIEAGKISISRRHPYADRLRARPASARRRRQGRCLHLVPDAGQSGDGAEKMDRRFAGAARRAGDRRRRGARAALGKEPAAGWCDKNRRRLRARRRCSGARAGRRRDRPRAHRL